MTRITVRASGSYEILIGSGILSTIGQEIRKLGKASRVCIVSDSNVWPLYGEVLEQSLISAGFRVYSHVFQAGEESKNSGTYLDLLHFFAVSGLTRGDLAVALGGGVTGDLTGFAAATYLRGIRYVQVPTTLLAAADSSVGGKTAIDLPEGKNLVGAFWQPSLVLCDVDTLDTLPGDVLRDGFAEVVKYGVLYDPEFFRFLETQSPEGFEKERVISRCVEWKREAVTRDEFDRDQRRMLNLGHTIGHGIEARSGYAVSHGAAVAAGMAIIARAAHCPDAERIQALLKRWELPVGTDYSAEELLSYILSDKKREEEAITFIIPRSIGDCACISVPVSRVEDLIREGL